jgi:hypothetical protein
MPNIAPPKKRQAMEEIMQLSGRGICGCQPDFPPLRSKAVPSTALSEGRRCDHGQGKQLLRGDVTSEASDRAHEDYEQKPYSRGEESPLDALKELRREQEMQVKDLWPVFFVQRESHPES